MIKKLKSSLTAKIFMSTALLLTVCCVATYAFIAWLIPNIYPGQIDLAGVETFAERIREEFQNASCQDMTAMAESIEEAGRTQYGRELELHLFDASGLEVYGDGAAQNTIQAYDDDKRTGVKYVTFLDSAEVYAFFLRDGSQAVNQAAAAINKAFPYLITTILVISIFASFFYSKFITSPILKISRMSQRMADLDFSVQPPSVRADELGVVHSNLAALSEKLAVTLEKLEHSNQQLTAEISRERQLEQQKTEFFSAVSHELKTPITVVKGQLQGMIGEIGRYKDRNTYLVKSLEVINSLETMVQEILTVSRMDTPGYTLHREVFDVTLLLKNCLSAQEDVFMQRDCALTLDAPDPIEYNGDPRLLKRVFDNLISNALHYSPTGSRIHVSLQRVGAQTCFSIENTGVHIAPEELPRLFEAFYRPDQSRSRETGGSGLGLYIVKRILDLHDTPYFIENSKDGVIFRIQFE